MLGARLGIRGGISGGPAPGVSADRLGGAGWTIDAASSKGTPASAAELNAMFARAGLSIAASGLYLMQEASGNMLDSIGTAPLVAAGTTRNYQQSVTGWTRKFITNSADGGTSTWSSTDASLPDLSTTSFAMLAYVLMPTAAPAAARNLIAMAGSGAGRADASLTTGPVVRGLSTTTNITNGTSNPVGASTVRPIVLMSDKTNSRARVYTDQDKISPTFGAVTGKALTLGSNSGGAIAGGYGWGFTLFGAAAERTDAQWKSILQTLNWTIPWS